MFGVMKYEPSCIDCLFFSRVDGFLYYGSCSKLEQHVDSLGSCPTLLSARTTMQKFYEENREANRILDIIRDVNEYAFVQDYQSIDDMMENFHVQDDGVAACPTHSRDQYFLSVEKCMDLLNTANASNSNY